MPSQQLRSCPTCGHRTLKPVHGPAVLKIKRRRVTIPDLDYLRCTHCGEELFDSDASRKIDAFLAVGRRRIPTHRKSA